MRILLDSKKVANKGKKNLHIIVCKRWYLDYYLLSKRVFEKREKKIHVKSHKNQNKDLGKKNTKNK